MEHRKTKIISAFCGTGKTYICNQKNISAVEIEYWKYKEKGLQKEYCKDVEREIGKVDYIFISTDPEGLEILQEKRFNITLVYPEKRLRNEYLDRYIDRDSSHDFIGAFMKYWDTWIDALNKQKCKKHIVLKSGEYLYDKIGDNIKGGKR
ncbi:MAG: hypothetical protein GY870_09195 [archaeon]|nr:hypothetical protein [archaeon]